MKRFILLPHNYHVKLAYRVTRLAVGRYRSRTIYHETPVATDTPRPTLMNNSSDNLSSRELAQALKTWLMETIRTEFDKNRPTTARSGEELGTMLDKSREADDATRKVRARRFREALAGLETLLMGTRELDYRSVLDRVIHNIGANFQALELFQPQQPLTNVPELDYRTLSAFPAKVLLQRYIAMPNTTQALSSFGLNRYWLPHTRAFLAEYREWQPRLFRRPEHDHKRIGLFAWSSITSRDITFLPMTLVSGARLMGTNELVMLGQRETLLSRLIDDVPRREEFFFRLSARDFTMLLRALLLDYETIYTVRQREVAEQDQLGSMLWDFLNREEE